MINFPAGGDDAGPAAHHPLPAPRRRVRRIAFSDTDSSASARASVSRGRSTGWVVNGPEVSAFEREFAAYVGAPYAVAVSSDTTALELSLRALRLPHGARVLVSTTTSCGVLHAIARADLRPVLMDVSPQTGRLTPRTVEDAALRRLPAESAPRALVVDHWCGDPADAQELAAAAGLTAEAVLQDVAQGLGAVLHGRPVGAGTTACYSFYSTANLPIGEGGMVTTDDPDRADQVRAARDLGVSSAVRRRLLAAGTPGYGLRDGGLAAGMKDLSAAVGREGLLAVRTWQEQRRGHALAYDDALGGLPGVGLPSRPSPSTGQHAWHLYPVRVRLPGADRSSVVRALDAAGVGTGGRLVPLHQLTHCRTLCEIPPEGLPGADQLADEVVLLPLYPRLRGDAPHRVADVVTSLLGDRTVVRGSA